jgi:hypothetical protein
MTAYELIIEKGKEIGADGLCDPEQTCGCGFDDFAPCCDGVTPTCELAKHRDCVGCDRLKEGTEDECPMANEFEMSGCYFSMAEVGKQ